MRGLGFFLILLLTAPATASARSLGEVAMEVFNTLTAEGEVVRVKTSSQSCKVRLAAAGWVKTDCKGAIPKRKKSL